MIQYGYGRFQHMHYGYSWYQRSPVTSMDEALKMLDEYIGKLTKTIVSPKVWPPDACLNEYDRYRYVLREIESNTIYDVSYVLHELMRIRSLNVPPANSPSPTPEYVSYSKVRFDSTNHDFIERPGWFVWNARKRRYNGVAFSELAEKYGPIDPFLKSYADLCSCIDEYNINKQKHYRGKPFIERSRLLKMPERYAAFRNAVVERLKHTEHV